MPKMKTHKGTAKRVRITGSGKIMLRARNPKRNKRARSKLYQNLKDVASHTSVNRAIRKNLPYA